MVIKKRFLFPVVACSATIFIYFPLMLVARPSSFRECVCVRVIVVERTSAPSAEQDYEPCICHRRSVTSSSWPMWSNGMLLPAQTTNRNRWSSERKQSSRVRAYVRSKGDDGTKHNTRAASWWSNGGGGRIMLPRDRDRERFAMKCGRLYWNGTVVIVVVVRQLASRWRSLWCTIPRTAQAGLILCNLNQMLRLGGMMGREAQLIVNWTKWLTTCGSRSASWFVCRTFCCYFRLKLVLISWF